MSIGARVFFDASTAPIEIRVVPGAHVVVGDDVTIHGGASIEAECSVHIGDRCTIGSFARILDGHFHRLDGNRHLRPPAGRVVVEDDVELGPLVVLLQNAHVGRGSLVHAGTVISRRYPPGVILAGLPAAVRGRCSPPSPRI